MKRLAVLLAFTAAVFFGINTAQVRAAEKVFDDFEGENEWVDVGWDNVGGVDLAISAEKASEGKKSLKVAAREEVEDWKNRVVFSKEAELDLSDVNMVLDIYSDAPAGISVQVGFDTAGDYYESQKKLLNQGWNKDITFGLAAKDFKCKASDWQYNQPLADRSDITKVFIIVNHPKKMKNATVFIDNVRFK
jgi:hypothetical protein